MSIFNGFLLLKGRLSSVGSGRKTVNSQGDSELREPIKTRYALLCTDLVNTN